MTSTHGRRTAPHEARDTAHNRRSSIARFAQRRPLFAAGAGLALGIALGALLPWSRLEDELLGDQAGKVKDAASEMASGGYEKAKSVARDSYQAATEAIRSSETEAASSAPIIKPNQTEPSETDPYSR